MGWGVLGREGAGEPPTCRCPLEEGQILAHQAGEEPMAGAQFEPGLCQDK